VTHEELLAKINHQADRAFQSDSYGWIALRAVVELTGEDIKHESYVWLDGYDFAMKRIIQAIEKELK